MSRVGSRTISGTPSAFLSLASATALGPEVGHRGGHDHDVGAVGPASRTASSISGRGLDPDHLDARRRRAGRRW